MKRITLVFSTFLALTAFDIALFRRKRESHGVGESSISVSLEEELRQRKIAERLHRRQVIPPWVEKPARPLRMKVNYFSTKPRDPRYSNQRKIRRMFSNS